MADGACGTMAISALEVKQLNDRIAELEGQVAQLRESISPGRIGTHEYYVGVAKRFRQNEIDAGRVLRANHLANEATSEIQFCTRAEGHSGPCNGFPRMECPQ